MFVLHAIYNKRKHYTTFIVQQYNTLTLIHRAEGMRKAITFIKRMDAKG